MKMINSIPNYEAIVQPLKGKVKIEEGRIYVGNVEVPKKFHSKLYKRAGNMELQEAVETKELYLRGRVKDSAVDWFGLVTDKFMSMPISELGEALHKNVKNGVIRYDLKRERFVVSYGVGKFPETTHVFLDSADFGTYGGNGEMSVRTGVALYGQGRNHVAVLLDDLIKHRFIHRWDKTNIRNTVEEIVIFGEEMSEHLGDNDLQTYLESKDVVDYPRQLSLF